MFIYVIDAGPWTKIGGSADPLKRFSGIKSSNPEARRIVKAYEVPDSLWRTAEAEAKKYLGSVFRQSGEFFAASADVVCAKLDVLLPAVVEAGVIAKTGRQLRQEHVARTMELHAIKSEVARRGTSAFPERVRKLALEMAEKNGWRWNTWSLKRIAIIMEENLRLALEEKKLELEKAGQEKP